MHGHVLFTTESGDTRRLILANGAGLVAQMDNPQIIVKAFEKLIDGFKKEIDLPTIAKNRIPTFSRREQVKTLAKILDSCLSGTGHSGDR